MKKEGPGSIYPARQLERLFGQVGRVEMAACSGRASFVILIESGYHEKS
jgi:hypothetical protein